MDSPPGRTFHYVCERIDDWRVKPLYLKDRFQKAQMLGVFAFTDYPRAEGTLFSDGFIAYSSPMFTPEMASQAERWRKPVANFVAWAAFSRNFKKNKIDRVNVCGKDKTSANRLADFITVSGLNPDCWLDLMVTDSQDTSKHIGEGGKTFWKSSLEDYIFSR